MGKACRPSDFHRPRGAVSPSITWSSADRERSYPVRRPGGRRLLETLPMTTSRTRSIAAAALLGVLSIAPRPAVAGYVLNTLAAFYGSNGSSPYSGVTLDAQGNLFGTTRFGGANGGGFGTVFELAAGTHALTTIAAFN